MPKRPSATRRQALMADAEVMQQVYGAACLRFGDAAVAGTPSLLWTMRCIQGMHDLVPFRATVSRTLSDWMFVAREVCGVRGGPASEDSRMAENELDYVDATGTQWIMAACGHRCGGGVVLGQKIALCPNCQLLLQVTGVPVPVLYPERFPASED